MSERVMYFVCHECGELTRCEQTERMGCAFCGASGVFVRENPRGLIVGSVISYSPNHSPHSPEFEAQWSTASGARVSVRLAKGEGVRFFEIKNLSYLIGCERGMLNATPEVASEELRKIAEFLEAISEWEPGKKFPPGTWVVPCDACSNFEGYVEEDVEDVDCDP